MKITINKDNYLKAIEKVVDLEKDAIKRIIEKEYVFSGGKYTTIESVYNPIIDVKIERAVKKVLKEAKKIGISESKAMEDMSRQTCKMRNEVRENAERIMRKRNNM